MLYSVLIYAADGVYDRLPPEEQERALDAHRALQARLAARGGYATAQLTPVSAAVTLRGAPDQAKPLVVDGPFAETKERFMGFYVVQAGSLEEVIDLVGEMGAQHDAVEIRPIQWAGGMFETL